MKSKKYQQALKQIDKNKVYSIEEAIDIIKRASHVRFDASVELHIRLGVDTKKSDQNVRGSIVLPHGTGKSKKVAAIVGQDKEKEAKEAGADVVITSPIQDLKSYNLNLKSVVIIATPDVMPELAKAAKVLGPKGLMPNPKTDTVGINIEKMIKEQKAGKVNFKNDDTGNIHQIFGKISYDTNKLLENFETLISAIKKAKPSTMKGELIKNATISSSMGPSIKITV